MPDILKPIFNSLISNYWNAVSNLSHISVIYSGVTGEESWLKILNNNLKTFCVDTLMEAFEGIGLAVALTYFLISIIGLVTEDRFTPEFLVKFFAKLVISVAVITWSGSLLTGIIEFGDTLGGYVSSITAEKFVVNEEEQDMYTSFEIFVTNFSQAVANETGMEFDNKVKVVKWKKDGGAIIGCSYNSPFTDKFSLKTLQAIGLAIPLSLAGALVCLVSLILIPIIMAAVLFIEVSRLLELYIRGSLLPIAAGVMADDGWRGAGGRYFKKVLALASQKLMLDLSCVVTSAMTTSYLMSKLQTIKGNDIWGFIGDSFLSFIIAIVIALAGISFMFKSLQVVNDLWGAS